MRGEQLSGQGEEANNGADWTSLTKMQMMPRQSSIDDRKTIRRSNTVENDKTFEYIEPNFKVGEGDSRRFGEYFQLRHRDNAEMLRQKTPHLLDTYKKLIEENPVLACVKLKDERITDKQGNEYGNAFFRVVDSEENGNQIPTVSFNFSNFAIYSGGKEGGSENLAARQQAAMLGVREEDFLGNAKVMSTFIFLHEMGHAYDFFYRYLAPNGGVGVKLGELRKRLPKAIEGFTVDYSEGKCKGTIPLNINKSESDMGVEAWRDFLVARGRQRGLKGMDVRWVSSKDYRQVKAESRADRFAADFMQRHWQDYLCADGEKRADKLEAGGWYDVNRDDFQILTGLMEGAKVNCTKYERDEQGRAVVKQQVTGYLAVTPMEGGMIAVADRPDPATWKPLMKENGLGIKVVKRKMHRREDGEMENYVYIADKGGREFVFSFADKKDGEDIIEENAESMNKRLRLGVGSRLQIVKVGMENREASDINSGSVLGGQLSQEIEEGHGVHFGNGAHSSQIKRVYRKWKTFYLETITGGTYEVVPVDAYKK